jgi:DNA-binding FadR family transcriptional regulator
VAKARKGNLTDHVAGAVGRSIVSGDYAPGSVFLINELCETFNASRTVMREAVKTLTAKGLVTSRPSVGSIVEREENWNLSDPDVLDWFLHVKGNTIPLIREFNEFRLAIEPTAAAMAARAGNAHEIDAIDKALERMRAAERDEDDALDADVAFHVAILYASGNRFFLNMRHTIDVALRIAIRVTNRSKGVTGPNVPDHAKIADAIRAGDETAASDAMRSLLLESRSLLTGRTPALTDI